MANNKIGRINDDIQHSLSMLLRSIKDPRIQQGMLSITRVDTSGDLRQAKIYLSLLNMDSEKELNKGLKSASGWLRRELGNALKLRHVPELVFILDRSIEHGAHINELLSGIEFSDDEDSDDDDLDGDEDDDLDDEDDDDEDDEDDA